MPKRKFLTLEDFKSQSKAGESPDGLAILRKQYACDEVKGIDTEARKIKFIISTESIDRYGDSVSAKGWDLGPYKKNPVVLFAHDNGRPPIAKATEVRVENNRLVATAQFPNRELSDFAFMIYQLYLEGYMRATSVGFIPHKWSWVEDKDRVLGIDFEEQELLEFSAVPVPANPEALIDAKSHGIEIKHLIHWAEKVIDEWVDDSETGLTMPKSALIALAKGDGKTVLQVIDGTAKEVESDDEKEEEDTGAGAESQVQEEQPEADADASPNEGEADQPKADTPVAVDAGTGDEQDEEDDQEDDSKVVGDEEEESIESATTDESPLSDDDDDENVPGEESAAVLDLAAGFALDVLEAIDNDAVTAPSTLRQRRRILDTISALDAASQELTRLVGEDEEDEPALTGDEEPSGDETPKVGLNDPRLRSLIKEYLPQAVASVVAKRLGHNGADRH
jgi:HK97 family phage prohead protease